LWSRKIVDFRIGGGQRTGLSSSGLLFWPHFVEFVLQIERINEVK
jgi:hypothetical protein